MVVDRLMAPPTRSDKRNGRSELQNNGTGWPNKLSDTHKRNTLPPSPIPLTTKQESILPIILKPIIPKMLTNLSPLTLLEPVFNFYIEFRKKKTDWGPKELVNVLYWKFCITLAMARKNSNMRISSGFWALSQFKLKIWTVNLILSSVLDVEPDCSTLLRVPSSILD